MTAEDAQFQPNMMPDGFFEGLKSFVGFDAASTETLRSFHPLASPHFTPIIDDFYRTIEAHPGALAAITGGDAQIERLKQTLILWLDGLLTGPHDHAYFERRARIGRVHVAINLPQEYMFTAMNRIRSRLLAVTRDHLTGDAPRLERTIDALNQILDIELAIMLETYREDLLVKNRGAERLATIGQFAASIGHELRNPLGVIESSLFLLRQHLGPEAAGAPNVAKHLDRIGGEVSRANKTIHDVLDLVRRRSPRRQRTEVRWLVEGATRVASLPAKISIEVDTTPADLAIDVDPDLLRQVLINLFTNAAHAMPDGGHIRLAGEVLPSGLTHLRVHDDGPGVPVEARYRLFEALFTTKAKGSGLGLALCRRIMEAHGGSIDLDQNVSGAAFDLLIPAPGPTPSLDPARAGGHR